MSRFWPLSQFYFFYFASLGALVPFWSVYLKSLGFSALQIGQLMATLALTKIVAPYLWGWIADRSGYHIRIVQLTSLLALLCFLPLLWLDGYRGVLLAMIGFSFFWNAALPQFEVVTLARLGDQKHRYSRIRLWGSLGFIVTVSLLGLLLQRIGIDALPLVLLGLFLLIWLSSLPVREHRAAAGNGGHILQVLKQPSVLALLFSCFLMQASHGPYYTFYSLYMEGFGYSRGSIGLLWALGVLAEVGLFWFMHRLFERRAAGFWLSLALALASLRWLMMALFPDVLPLVLLAQTLHAASFGMYHASAIHLIDEFFPRHRGRGQALYAAVSFGAGGAFGSLYAGTLWDTVSPMTTFLAASLAALLGLLVSLKVREPAAAGR
jgi:PPP family 3-phenylpropionic acid transporter